MEWKNGFVFFSLNYLAQHSVRRRLKPMDFKSFSQSLDHVRIIRECAGNYLPNVQRRVFQNPEGHVSPVFLSFQQIVDTHCQNFTESWDCHVQCRLDYLQQLFIVSKLLKGWNWKFCLVNRVFIYHSGSLFSERFLF